MAFGFFKKKQEVEKAPEAKASSSSVHYFNLRVREVIQETPDAFSIVFDHPADKKITYKPGQFFTLIPTVDGAKVRRAYSVCTSPYTDPYPAVTVKRVEGGIVSNFLGDHLKAGDTLEVMEPMGHFTIEPEASRKRHIMLFGGGSGITPLMSIAKSILELEKGSQVSLIYANRNEESIIFRKGFEELKQQHGNRFTIIHVLDQPPAGWTGPSGLLTPANLPALIDQLPQWPADAIEYYICGPEGLMICVEQTLQALNIPKTQIHKESFVPGKADKAVEQLSGADAAGAAQAHEVTVILDGEEYKFTVEPDKTILETALSLDIDLPYSCQSGLCTACRGKCISGKVRLVEDEGLSDQEKEEGYVLTCVGHPITDNVVIEIG
ncbi:ferredoxin--NADP reductase [Cesiribacter andamanensis]|uniref:3-ketosteroid-9-alpha-hydroxylase reductase subunit n=1 Tax=Cesiribacter andamanensis AMV16 TaxID=1279009 RepID=M7N7I4_9BACT|nr:ferredoxin--NADP reductase [Cesiribacter andamanensis]EMR04568.1 3-ketosteroid-9-alpha-hydroxylase reductase subunit [Cesiribacter andamanensis AMV16]